VYGEHAHYAVTRAIGQLGLGKRRGVPIASRNYKMDVDLLLKSLDRLRDDGKAVMAVVATAGTTATGSFDATSRRSVPSARSAESGFTSMAHTAPAGCSPPSRRARSTA